MKVLLTLLALLIGLFANAQSSFFARFSLAPTTYKHPTTQSLVRRNAISLGDSTLPTPSEDSVYNGPRFGGLSVVYGVTPGYTASNVAALLGLDWTNAKYTASTKRWYVNWTAGVCVGSNTHSAPANIQEVVCAGVRATLVNGFIVVAALYNFTRPTGATSNFMGATGGNTFFIPTN